MQVKMNLNTSMDFNQSLNVIESQYDYRWQNFCASHAQAADYFCVAAQDLKVAQVCGIGQLPQGDRIRALTITLFAAVDFLGAEWVEANLINQPYLHTATFYKLAGAAPAWIVQRLSAAEIEISVMQLRAETAKFFELQGETPVIQETKVESSITELDSVEITTEDAAQVEQAVTEAAEATAEVVETQAATEETVEEEGATDEAGEVQANSPSPVVVDLEVSAEEANAKYGDRYGIDWVYEGE